jgi:peptidyl-prolyl cis-trans isomerase C
MRRSKNNSSKNLFLAVAVIGCVGVVGAYVVLKGNPDKIGGGVAFKESGTVVAEVNGKPIYSSEAERQFSNMLQGSKDASFEQLDEKAKFVVIREIAAQKVILEEAYKQGVDDKDDVQRRINDFKEGVIKEEFLSQMAKDQVTDEKIKQRYDSDVVALKGKSQFKIKHILVKTENDAQEVQKLLKVNPFEQVAKHKSIDDKTALTGGDLGYVIEGNMIPEIEKAITPLAVGSVSQPVKTSFGWHIIKLEGKAAAEPAPYDQVKALLARALYQEAIQNYVKKSIENVKIEMVASAEKEPEKTETLAVESKEGEAKEPVASSPASEPTAVQEPATNAAEPAPAMATEPAKEEDKQ